MTSILDFSRIEIETFTRRKLARHKIQAAYFFGSFAQDLASAWSDIDLLIVMSTTLPFLERPRIFDDLYELGLPIDILVYTPEEFSQLKNSDSGFWSSFRKYHQRIV
ncbi:MAG: nucleotidyltransferase domain-containing protein [Desulfuromusa sp.]